MLLLAQLGDIHWTYYVMQGGGGVFRFCDDKVWQGGGSEVCSGK